MHCDVTLIVDYIAQHVNTIVILNYCELSTIKLE